MWMPCLQRLIHLVGGFNPSEKYEFVNGKDDIPYKCKIKFMFETINQTCTMETIYSTTIYKVRPPVRSWFRFTPWWPFSTSWPRARNIMW